MCTEIFIDLLNTHFVDLVVQFIVCALKLIFILFFVQCEMICL